MVSSTEKRFQLNLKKVNGRWADGREGREVGNMQELGTRQGTQVCQFRVGILTAEEKEKVGR